jgi:hypothetical protein
MPVHGFTKAGSRHFNSTTGGWENRISWKTARHGGWPPPGVIPPSHCGAVRRNTVKTVQI